MSILVANQEDTDGKIVNGEKGRHFLVKFFVSS